IIVEDDGKGFSHPNVRTSNTGMGLFSIRERLRSVGGEMKIVSVPLKGTTISLVAPISAHI
ncbi:MAG: histidine kinase, partial [Cloacibacillus sp.]